LQQLRLRRIEVELRGLPVAGAYRSYGSMIHFQFGELHLEKSGKYGLMVEIAA